METQTDGSVVLTASEAEASGATVWGIRPSTRGVNPPYWWGARAIYDHTGNVDIVWDRCGFCGASLLSEREALAAWVNEKALPFLRNQSKTSAFPGREERCDWEVYGDGFYLVCNPNASHGYLYIAAWPDASRREATPVAASKQVRGRRRPAR